MDLARVNCVLLLRSVVAVLAVWTGACGSRGAKRRRRTTRATGSGQVRPHRTFELWIKASRLLEQTAPRVQPELLGVRRGRNGTAGRTGDPAFRAMTRSIRTGRDAAVRRQHALTTRTNMRATAGPVAPGFDDQPGSDSRTSGGIWWRPGGCGSGRPTNAQRQAAAGWAARRRRIGGRRIRHRHGRHGGERRRRRSGRCAAPAGAADPAARLQEQRQRNSGPATTPPWGPIRPAVTAGLAGAMAAGSGNSRTTAAIAASAAASARRQEQQIRQQRQ